MLATLWTGIQVVKKAAYRQATLERIGKGVNTSWKGFCPACADRGPRRGAMATFKSTDSEGRNTWWDRHKNHHEPPPVIVGKSWS